MSEAELDLVLGELAPLVGTQLQKIVQPDEHTVGLRLMRSWLLLGARPRACRMHLLSDRPRDLPAAAPAFCMLLRKVLLNGRLMAVERVPGERVVRLELTGGVLLAELIDRRSNLLLLDSGGRLLGSLGPPRAGLEQGRPYSPPTPPPPGRRTPGVRQGRGSSAGLEDFYRDLALEERRTGLRRRVARTLKKARRTLKKVQADQARCQDADRYRKWADLLMAQQSMVRGKGRESVPLPDLFEAGETVVIPLDPRLGVVDNARALYRKQGRLTRGLEHVGPRLEAARARLEALEQLAGPLTPGVDPVSDETARQVEALCPARGTGQRRPGQKGAVSRTPYRQFESIDGLEILVGRGAKENHELTFKVARGNDLWLHLRDSPGCHGVVRSPGREPVPRQSLLDAATLVAHFSQVKPGETVDLTHTLRKNVRPVQGAPGRVYLSDAKTLRIEVQKARLDRLLKR